MKTKPAKPPTEILGGPYSWTEADRKQKRWEAMCAIMPELIRRSPEDRPFKETAINAKRIARIMVDVHEDGGGL